VNPISKQKAQGVGVKPGPREKKLVVASELVRKSANSSEEFNLLVEEHRRDLPPIQATAIKESAAAALKNLANAAIFLHPSSQ